MSTQPDPVLLAKLAELVNEWQAHRYPAGRYYLPGLTEEELDGAALPEGFVLTPELRAWWTWHNGRDDGIENEAYEEGLSTGGFNQLSLAEAVQTYRWWMDYTQEYLGSDPDVGWVPTWIPFAHAGPTKLVIDLAQPAGITTPSG